jgi:hypothetical protein
MTQNLNNDTHFLLFPEKNGPIMMDGVQFNTTVAIPYGNILEVKKVNNLMGHIIARLSDGKVVISFKISDHLGDFVERNNGKKFINGQEVIISSNKKNKE